MCGSTVTDRYGDDVPEPVRDLWATCNKDIILRINRWEAAAAGCLPFCMLHANLPCRSSIHSSIYPPMCMEVVGQGVRCLRLCRAPACRPDLLPSLQHLDPRQPLGFNYNKDR